jgi:protein-L-isoaspartate(D-aspartate) O-methyltransferase
MDKKHKMIKEHLIARNITDRNVLLAMKEIDRKAFVPDEIKQYAYEDSALPIGDEQTISQPFIVAYMAQNLDLKPTDKVLEIGSGCGYNAAVLSRLSMHVYSVEIVDKLAVLAKKNLEKTNHNKVSIRLGNGFHGWAEKAPFDKIVLTVAPKGLPQPLKEQLKIGGKLLVPVSNSFQRIMVVEKTGPHFYKTMDLMPVSFVAMTGVPVE